MDQVAVKRVKGLRIAIAAFVLSVFLFVAVVVGGIWIATSQSTSTKDFSRELRDGLVKSCQQNGNPLREAVQAQLREQIQQRQKLDYARFFPNVPRAELEALIQQQNRADQATLKQIAPVACADLYPKP